MKNKSSKAIMRRKPSPPKKSIKNKDKNLIKKKDKDVKKEKVNEGPS